jgi:hypothetical protein
MTLPTRIGRVETLNGCYTYLSDVDLTLRDGVSVVDLHGREHTQVHCLSIAGAAQHSTALICLSQGYAFSSCCLFVLVPLYMCKNLCLIALRLGPQSILRSAEPC